LLPGTQRIVLTKRIGTGGRMKKHTVESCTRSKLAIRDTLDIVGGKWKLVLIAVLRNGDKGFNELSRELGISPRILSKELQELEVNGLVSREVYDTKPVTVKYQLTDYSASLNKVLQSLEQWGLQHRSRIVSKAKRTVS